MGQDSNFPTGYANSGEQIQDKSLPFAKVKDSVRVVKFSGGIANAGTPFAIMDKVRAGKWVLKEVSIELTEVPDASAKTMTVVIEDGSGNDAIAALTFTEGTDALGSIQDGVVVSTAHRVFTETETIKVLVGGTSVLLGKFKGIARFLEL